MQRVKAVAPAAYMKHVVDAEKRLNLLFDQLNNGAIGAESLAQLQALADAFRSRNYDQAQSVHTTLAQSLDVSQPAMVGVMSLIKMSRATPV